MNITANPQQDSSHVLCSLNCPVASHLHKQECKHQTIYESTHFYRAATVYNGNMASYSQEANRLQYWWQKT